VSRIPSIQALRALESFARHGTVWQAADELALTRSAVSHQLRLLERELDFAILNRIGTRVELTTRGRAYAEDVRRALSSISASAARNASQGIAGSITVSSPAGFATSWLCTNIARFLAAHPDVTVSLTTPRRRDDISNPDVDLFVTFAHEFPPGTRVELMQRVEFTPLCSPAYLNEFGGFSDRRSLMRATLLHIGDYADWEQWMRLIGLPAEAAHRGLRCSDMNLVYAAALASQGIAMGDEFVCADAMARGLLVRPFDVMLPSEDSYHLVTPKKSIDNPTVDAFATWLLDEMRGG
jgi:LysR family glycine cleavage system transcriptional activator